MRSSRNWKRPLLTAPLFALALSASCKGDTSTGTPPPTAQQSAPSPTEPATSSEEGVLATVNGVPITEADVEHALHAKSKKRGAKVDPAARAGVVETLIRQELVYQAAVAAGLDKSERYQEELRRLKAAAKAFEREGLQDVFYRKEMEARTAVTDAEVKDFYDTSGTRLRTEIHVEQILARTADDIAEVEGKLKAGESFEDVAKTRFRALPPSGPMPWDLGYLRWKQLPEPWRDVVFELEPGQVSGVIRGPSSRHWIVKVLDKREVPDVTFEALKPMIIDDIKSRKLLDARTKLDQELRGAAAIVRFGATGDH